MFLFRITILQNYKQEIEQEKFVAMEDPTPSEFYRHFRRRVCVILQPIKSKFPQKVPEHVTSRSLSTAPGTTFASGHLKDRHRRWW